MKSDMKSHLKFVHGERDERRIEEIVLKCSTVVERSKNWVDPGFFVFKGRSKKSVDSSVPSTSTPTSMETTTASTPAITPSASVVRSMLATAVEEGDAVEFNVHIPSSLSLSTISTAAKSTSPTTTASSLEPATTTATTKISLLQYKARPAKELPILPPHVPSLLPSQDCSTQTSHLDLKEAFLPPIPETIKDLQEYIRTLCDHMDKVGRLREAAKEKLLFLQREGPSLQREKEIHRKLESENRELRRQLAEAKWRDSLFPPMVK